MSEQCVIRFVVPARARSNNGQSTEAALETVLKTPENLVFTRVVFRLLSELPKICLNSDSQILFPCTHQFS